MTKKNEKCGKKQKNNRDVPRSAQIKMRKELDFSETLNKKFQNFFLLHNLRKTLADKEPGMLAEVLL